jgi:cell fate regulator YaaT (PSP1 superfamily)
MEQVTEPLVVGVRFSKVGKVYHFVADTVNDLKVGDNVVVETSRGWQLGQVAQIVQNPVAPPEGWKPIDRRATPRDLLLRQMWQMKEAEVVTNCKAKSDDLKLVGIKIVSAEYSFDGSRLTIFFSSETEEKYDLKSLRQDMQKMYAPSQVEMRQIGPRDVAKTVCGMGACGLETRCCCMFLTEFSSISIRMAKEQGISLTPTEITGMCGRLRCCLIYEYDTYVEARQKLPKRNKRVRTPQGEGKVVDVIPLRGSVVVDLPEIGTREFLGNEVQLVEATDSQGAAQAQTPEAKDTTIQGSEQASVMDQAITGDSAEKPFELPTSETPVRDTPRPAANAERPAPRGDRPRQNNPSQRSDRPQRQQPPRSDGPRKGDEKKAQSGAAQAGNEQRNAGDPQQQQPRRDRGQRPWPGKGSRNEGKPKGAGPNPAAGPQAKSGDQPGEPQKPKNEADGGAQAPKGNRDHRRKRGRRRDNKDSENRA